MVHVSDMSDDFVSNPSDVVKIGDVVKVGVKEVDELGRVNLSMLLDHDKPKSVSSSRTGGRDGGSRGGYSSGGGYRRRDDRGTN